MLLKSKNSGLVYQITVVLVLCLGITDMGYSQSSNLISNNYDKNYADTERADNSGSYYTANFREVPLKKALQMLSEKAGLTLSYRSGLFRSSKEVSVDLDDIKVEETLDKLLADTELKYKITETRHLVIYRKLGHIKGNVITFDSGDPLHGAKVYLVESKYISGLAIKFSHAKRNTFVGPTGRFNISNVEAGTYRLIVMDKGLKKVYKKVKIKGDETTEKNFRLKYPRY